jgi:hypothetical protein
MDQDKAPFQIETIAGLSIAPHADLPFGKQVQMGQVIYTVYDRAIEQGYQAGVAAHFDYLHATQRTAPVILDETQFAFVLTSFTPSNLDETNAGLWKAHFIAGWASVFLGLSGLSEWLSNREHPDVS